MNQMLKHFFFSSIVTQVGAEVKHKLKKDLGKLISISFLVSHEKITQRIKFDHYEGDSDLTDDEKKKFCSMLNIDLEKEMKDNTSIFAVINCVNKIISVVYNGKDGQTKTINL